jgi:hypothetical protein
MRTSPSIVPDNTDREIYVVLDDFGLSAQVWRETNDAEADRATLIQDLLDGLYEAPIRIVAFNTAQGWSRDVIKDIAKELLEICSERGEIPVDRRLHPRTCQPANRSPAPFAGLSGFATPLVPGHGLAHQSDNATRWGHASAPAISPLNRELNVRSQTPFLAARPSF